MSAQVESAGELFPCPAAVGEEGGRGTEIDTNESPPIPPDVFAALDPTSRPRQRQRCSNQRVRGGGEQGRGGRSGAGLAGMTKGGDEGPSRSLRGRPRKGQRRGAAQLTSWPRHPIQKGRRTRSTYCPRSSDPAAVQVATAKDELMKEEAKEKVYVLVKGMTEELEIGQGTVRGGARGDRGGGGWCWRGRGIDRGGNAG